MTTEPEHIQSLLRSLSNQELEIAHNAIGAFLVSLEDFPKPVGIQGVTMSETEFERYHDGWDAAIEAASWLYEIAFGTLPVKEEAE